MEERLTITEVADLVGISPKTIVRWEKVGKLRRARRDWRGWRVYESSDIEKIRQFRENVVEVY